MNVPYVGNSAYCYTHSLAMCLQQAGATTLPETSFLECLTLMPFGAMVLKMSSGPLFFPSPASTNPDKSLTDALDTLGWEAEVWRGNDPDAALAELREVLRYGPALVGPLDMGYLPYDPNHRSKQGGDHFIVALRAEGDAFLVHDPQLYPYATIPASELVRAWNAGHLDYVDHAFTLRHGFHSLREVRRSEMITWTLRTVRARVSREPRGPVAYGGESAFQQLAELVRPGTPANLAGLLVSFALPLGAKRSLDAAAFVAEAGQAELAELFRARGEQYGRAQHAAVRKNWDVVAHNCMAMAEIERQLQAAFSSVSEQV